VPLKHPAILQDGNNAALLFLLEKTERNLYDAVFQALNPD